MPAADRPFRIILASDKFRGTLESAEIRWSLMRGCRRAERRESQQLQTLLVAMSDGGEGFGEATVDAVDHPSTLYIIARTALGTLKELQLPAIAGWKPMPNFWAFVNRIAVPIGLATTAILTAYFHPIWYALLAWFAFLPLVSVRIWWRSEAAWPRVMFLAHALLTIAMGGCIFAMRSSTDSTEVLQIFAHLTVIGATMAFLTSGLQLLLHSASQLYRGIITIESALLVGRDQVPIHARDPERLSTAGIGDAIQAAYAARVRCTAVGLGGTLTVDGGIGLASAFGYRFLNARGEELPPIGASLERIATIVKPKRFSKDWRALRAVRPQSLIAACDVMAPLTGPRGAAEGYARQKGASEDAVARLERGLASLQNRCIEAGLINADQRDQPGDGAAGGLGFGMRVFLGATLTRGAKLVAEWNHLESQIPAADLVITGEGSLDKQTLDGKVVAEILSLAAASSTPVAVICGIAKPDTQTMEARLRATTGCQNLRVFSLTDHVKGDQAMAQRFAGDLVAELACQAVMEAINARSRNEPLWPPPEELPDAPMPTAPASPTATPPCAHPPTNAPTSDNPLRPVVDPPNHG